MNSRGFTLIELLVVISILALLFVVLVPQLFGVRNAGTAAATEARIQALRVSISKYEREMGDFPPSEYARAEKGVKFKGDSTNVGIECLLIHLDHVSKNFAPSDDMTWYQNTDGDPSGNREIVDGWGNPFAYFHGDSYKVSQRIVLYGDGEGDDQIEGDEVTAKARKDDRGGYVGERKFQIISAGPDHEFNTGDDVHFPK